MDIVGAFLLIAIILVLCLAMIEIYMVLFLMTGLTREKARFQAISMITAVGFTTSESEIITSDRHRRHISIACMITGAAFNAVIIGLLINLVFSLNTQQINESIGIIILVRIPPITKFLDKVIQWLANKIFKINTKENVLTQLDIYGKDAIVQIKVNIVPPVLFDQTLAEADIEGKYNLNIMMIKRKNRVIPTSKDSIIQKGDVILVFGPKQAIHDLFTVDTYAIKEEPDDIKENTIDLIDNYGQDAMAEVELEILPDILKGKALSESDLRKKDYINVLKVKRHHAAINVDKDTRLEEGDTILVLGPHSNIHQIFDLREEQGK